ncbi:MAG: glycosyltransferase [Candidatus Latescibacteria bacterium]|nr:glycosyltransferase [bacterium]MBD3423347.1 glycosyltransferase [Candidatus Latescibacterota bacterium]
MNSWKSCGRSWDRKEEGDRLNRGLNEVTLIVITLNEEENIGDCLKSAPGVGEIIVVDSFSDDETVRIAEEAGARVYRREFISNAEQKNWAIEKASGEWILILDADERLSPALRREIADLLDNPEAEGYWLRRKNRFMNRDIKHCGWGNDLVLRLFRAGRGRYSERLVHEKLILEGRASRLENPVLHDPYRDMNDYLDRMNQYSRRGAEELHRDGKHWFPGIITHPLFRFFRMYFLQLGFLDGAAGFILCSAATAGVFFKYVYLKELREP